ncbi:MAG TPA: cyclase family protein [Povalibacter sp.]|nr:cyclase family protein [Povalibacter sp.]
MSERLSQAALVVETAGRRWLVDAARAIDLSIPLRFDGPQPSAFGADAAREQALEAGSFVGDVRRGGSCNCNSYSLTPHCNGTHTECVGHITHERISVRDIAVDHLVAALLLSVTPEASEATAESSIPAPQSGDRLITRKALQQAASAHSGSVFGALVIRTLPNDKDKLSRDYGIADIPPYFSVDAMRWIVECNVRHLVVDLPSLDRGADEGHLTTHRLFWGMPPGGKSFATATRANATVTELAYVDAAVADGFYLLNLQVAPFDADAAPSRPILYPAVPA